MLIKTILFQVPLSKYQQNFQNIFMLDAIFGAPFSLVIPWTLGTIPPTAFPSSEVGSHSIEHQDFSPPSLQTPSLFSPVLPDLFCLDAIRICLCGLPATPYMKYKYLLLDLISFVQFNKKGFHTILSIYIQHGRLIRQLKLVFFRWLGQLGELPAQLTFREMEVNTKRDVKWRKACILNIYLKKNVNTVVTFHALAGLERAVLGPEHLWLCSQCSWQREIHLDSGYMFSLACSSQIWNTHVNRERTVERTLWGQHGIIVVQKGLSAKGFSLNLFHHSSRLSGASAQFIGSLTSRASGPQ